MAEVFTGTITGSIEYGAASASPTELARQASIEVAAGATGTIDAKFVASSIDRARRAPTSPSQAPSGLREVEGASPFVVTGSALEENADGDYEVQSTAVAQIGSVKYNTLPEALRRQKRRHVTIACRRQWRDGIFLAAANAKNISSTWAATPTRFLAKLSALTGTVARACTSKRATRVAIKNGALTSHGPREDARPELLRPDADRRVARRHASTG